MIALALVSLLLVSSGSVIISPGTMTSVPNGYSVSNLDPTFNSTYNNEIYDPNFLPGFEAGLTNTDVSWTSGNGYGSLGYSVGPWTHEEGNSIPHFAVGPQCCNFVEVPHTQQFRQVDWGDYYYVRSGLGSPGINVENYTAVFGGPVTYVGLRTDWDWKVQLSLKWGNPSMMNSSNEWAAIGIDTTQVVPSAPGELVYTLINFWMDSNSSGVFAASSRDGRWVGASNLVTYHPVQIAGGGNETITVDISPYLEDTLQALGLTQYQSQPPLITYVYMNVEGYNFGWNTTLWSFQLMSPTHGSTSLITYEIAIVVFITAAVAIAFYKIKTRRLRS
jgi:hypothetical protein